MMQHVGTAIGSLFSPLGLPARIRVRHAFGPHAAGQVLEYSPADRAWLSADGRWALWALTVRQHWGTMFEEAPASEQQLALAVGV